MAAAAATVLALAVSSPAVSRSDSLASVDVYDRSVGASLPVYRHHGRRYVAGSPATSTPSAYRNNTAAGARRRERGRRECRDRRVASPDQSGYVLEPGGYVNIQGWRKDLDRTARSTSRTGRFLCRSHRTPEGPRRHRRGAVPRTRVRPACAAEPRATVGHANPRRRPRPTRLAIRAPGRRPARGIHRVGALPSLGTGHGRGEYSPVERVGVRTREFAARRDRLDPL